MTSENKPPQELIAPLRFGVVQPNLYRGSYPRPQNIRFLKRLRLKTILSVTPEGFKPGDPIYEFAKENDIQLIHIECAGAQSKSKKKRGIPMSYSVSTRAVEYMINADYAPMYVHCLNGSQVTSLIVACLRKLSFWSMAAIVDEFLRYSELEGADQTFVQDFRAEIAVPKNAVPWMWKGLSRLGVVKNHPTLKIHHDEVTGEVPQS